MLLLLQIILCCLLYLALVKCAVRDSGRNCLYFYPDAYLDEAQQRLASPTRLRSCARASAL